MVAINIVAEDLHSNVLLVVSVNLLTTTLIIVKIIYLTSLVEMFLFLAHGVNKIIHVHGLMILFIIVMLLLMK